MVLEAFSLLSRRIGPMEQTAWVAHRGRRTMKTCRERRLRRCATRRCATWVLGWIIGLAAMTGQAAETPDDVKEFDVAYEKAIGAAEEMESAQVELEFAQKEEPLDAKRVAELKATLETKRAEAFAWSSRAIALADAKTKLENLNLIRYMLCYFHYAMGNYYEAAVLGEFLAKKYPDAAKARPAAQVAMHALDALHREQKPAGDQAHSFELTRLLELADYVVTRWPEEPETGPAAALLMQYDIASGDLTKARATLNRLPQDSPARAEAEIKLGHALWSSYLRRMQQLREAKPAGGDGATQAASPLEDPKVKPELDSLLKQAQQSLEQGVAAIRKGKEPPNQRAMLGVLSLAQLYGNTSQAGKAVVLLEDPKLGPLTLLKENHPSASGRRSRGDLQDRDPGIPGNPAAASRKSHGSAGGVGALVRFRCPRPVAAAANVGGRRLRAATTTGWAVARGRRRPAAHHELRPG